MKAKYGIDSMPETAENVAAEFGVSRADQDAFALRSQQRAAAAIEAGRLAEEIVPVTIPSKKGDATVVSRDEHPRATTLEALAKLKGVVRPDGTVTAGNASGINDGACATLIASEVAARKHGLTPRARIVASAVAGVAPRIMGFGPAPATRKVLALAGLSMRDIDVIELNEAFAAQALAVTRDLGLPDDAAHVNPNGGAIALGHPLGASGARLATTATYELARRKGALRARHDVHRRRPGHRDDPRARMTHAPKRRVLLGLIGAGIQQIAHALAARGRGRRAGIALQYRVLDLDVLALGDTALPRLLDAARLAGFAGVNVTFPCKQAVIPLLDALSDDARAMNAVNTVVFRDGRATGHNTDASGFAAGFEARIAGRVARARRARRRRRRGLGRRARDARARHEGAAHRRQRAGARRRARARRGGRFPGRTIVAVRERARRAGRRRRRHQRDADRHGEAAGRADRPVAPRAVAMGRGLRLPADRHGAAAAARKRGCRTLDGGGMAVGQAVDAFRLFTGLEPDAARMTRHVRRGDRGRARGGLTTAGRAAIGCTMDRCALTIAQPAGSTTRSARASTTRPGRRPATTRSTGTSRVCRAARGSASTRCAARAGCWCRSWLRGIAMQGADASAAALALAAARLASAGRDRAALPAGASLAQPAHALRRGDPRRQRRSRASPIRSPPASRSSGCACTSSSPGLLIVDARVPSYAGSRYGAPLVEWKSVALGDGSQIRMRSETSVDADARLARTDVRYTHRHGALALGEEHARRATTWYAGSELAELLAEAGWRDVAEEASPATIDEGETGYVAYRASLSATFTSFPTRRRRPNCRRRRRIRRRPTRSRPSCSPTARRRPCRRSSSCPSSSCPAPPSRTTAGAQTISLAIGKPTT